MNVFKVIVSKRDVHIVLDCFHYLEQLDGSSPERLIDEGVAFYRDVVRLIIGGLVVHREHKVGLGGHIVDNRVIFELKVLEDFAAPVLVGKNVHGPEGVRRPYHVYHSVVSEGNIHYLPPRQHHLVVTHRPNSHKSVIVPNVLIGYEVVLSDDAVIVPYVCGRLRNHP